ncbi:DUF1349 domain-containing protein [Zavarzinella formosa]|uniref:hypothetical protein n=1 Tax=Zavarzinella formosa TaxID=360055 RepID=UPI0012FAC66C|nr:hypothetical protein [Zavarzinella formosa]
MRASILLLLIASLVVAAPAPKPAAKKIADVFGTAVEARGVTCEMSPRGELRVGVAKEAAAEGEDHGAARPLVTRKFEGDFQVTVRLAHVPSDAKDLSAVGDGKPAFSAGIALYTPADPTQSVTFLQQHLKEGETWKSDFFACIRYNTDVFESVRRPGEKLDRGPVYLRLTRRGGEFTSASSHDGKKWTPVASLGRFKFGSAVLIGPAATHNTSAGHIVTFDEYVLTKPPEEKK